MTKKKEVKPKSPAMSKREANKRFLPEPLAGRTYVNVAETAVLLDVPESRINNWNSKINKEHPDDLPEYLKSFPKRYLGPRVSFLYDKEEILAYKAKYEAQYTDARRIAREKQIDREVGWLRLSSAAAFTTLSVSILKKYFVKNYNFRVNKEECEDIYKNFPHVIMSGGVYKVKKDEFLAWEKERVNNVQVMDEIKTMDEIEQIWFNFIYGNRPRKRIGYF